MGSKPKTQLRYLRDITMHVRFSVPNVKSRELGRGLKILRSLEMGIKEGSIKSDLDVKFEGRGVVNIYPSSNLKVEYEGMENLHDCEVADGENCIVVNKKFLGDQFEYSFYKKGY